MGTRVQDTLGYPTQSGYSQAPALMHYMDISPQDGQYSFGYTASDSAREERRHADGTIEGKYSYRNPEGKIINVSYGADSKGFQAFGDHLPPADTPAVKEAKEKFMATYAREVARIRGTVPSATAHQLSASVHHQDPLIPANAYYIGGHDHPPDSLLPGQGHHISAGAQRHPSVSIPAQAHHHSTGAPQIHGNDIDDSEVVVASSEKDEDDHGSMVPVTPPPPKSSHMRHPNFGSVHGSRVTGHKKTAQKINEYVLPLPDYTWLYGLDPSPFYANSGFPAPTFLIPIPLSAVHGAQVPNYIQRNYAFTSRRTGRKKI